MPDDAEYACIVSDPNVSLTRATVLKFWGVDETRTEKQVLGLFGATGPLLVNGITSAPDAAAVSAARPGAVSDAAATAFEAMKEHNRNAWQGKAR